MSFLERLEDPILLAHRGISAKAPENTMAAFQMAYNMKVHGIELDVQICGSGEAVVFHDFTTARTTGAQKNIRETAFYELEQLDAGIWFDNRFRGEKIPSLEKVFQEYGAHFYYDIELKDFSFRNNGLEEQVALHITRNRLKEYCLVSSFNPVRLKRFQKICPSVPTALIYTDREESPFFLRNGQGRFLVKTEIWKPEYSHKHCLKERPAFYKNKPVIAWTVDSQDETAALLNSGVQGIISNDPSALNHLLYQ